MSFLSRLLNREAGSEIRLEPDDFLRRRAESGGTLIDVRTAREYAAAHLTGSTNIDISSPDFFDRVSALDREQTYYLYCRSGARSQRAAEVMRDLGFDAYNVGGLGALAGAGAATESD